MQGVLDMKIAIGCDHGAVAFKQHLLKYLEGKGYEVVNYGSDDPDSSDDYPYFAERVSKAVVSGECDRGVLICGTGIGISISANKIHGVRCALCSEPVSAALARLHNDANIIAMGARTIGPVMAEGILDVFLNTGFEGGRHQRRVDMIMKLDRGESVQ